MIWHVRVWIDLTPKKRTYQSKLIEFATQLALPIAPTIGTVLLFGEFRLVIKEIVIGIDPRTFRAGDGVLTCDDIDDEMGEATAFFRKIGFQEIEDDDQNAQTGG